MNSSFSREAACQVLWMRVALATVRRVRALAFLEKPLVEHSTHLVQFVKFGVVGGLGGVMDMLIFSVLQQVVGWAWLPSKTVSFTYAASQNFVLNKCWTFKGGGGQAGKQYVQFFVVSVGGYLWNLLILSTLIDRMGLHPILSNVIAIGIVSIWNFLVNKLWTFRPPAEG